MRYGIPQSSSGERNSSAAALQQALIVKADTSASRIMKYSRGFPTRQGNTIASAELTTPKANCEI